MIRAHMASFPARRETLLNNIHNILPQVDRLFLVLNEYESIPIEIAQNDKIEAVIPDQDLKDVGKFYFPVEDDDIVFTMDDDLVYPEGYVDSFLKIAEFLDLEAHVLSLHGLVPEPEIPYQWKYYHFRKGLKSVIGVSRVGTGVSVMKGKNYPPLEAMQGAEGFVDLRHAAWHLSRGNLMWTIPRTRGWVKGNAPPEIAHLALFAKMSQNPPQQLLKENAMLWYRRPENCDTRFYQWKKAKNAGVI